MNNRYDDTKNVGLMTSFNLVDGKFQLNGGVVKCQDNVRMLIIFGGWFRLMKPDFCVNLYWMLQKPTSWLQTFKVVMLGRFILAAEKYAPFIKIQKSNLYYDSSANNKKELVVGIEYTYTLDTLNKPNQYTQKIV